MTKNPQKFSDILCFIRIYEEKFQQKSTGMEKSLAARRCIGVWFHGSSRRRPLPRLWVFVSLCGSPFGGGSLFRFADSPEACPYKVALIAWLVFLRKTKCPAVGSWGPIAGNEVAVETYRGACHYKKCQKVFWEFEGFFSKKSLKKRKNIFQKLPSKNLYKKGYP